jgi:hypothetical protein
MMVPRHGGSGNNAAGIIAVPAPSCDSTWPSIKDHFRRHAFRRRGGCRDLTRWLMCRNLRRKQRTALFSIECSVQVLAQAQRSETPSDGSGDGVVSDNDEAALKGRRTGICQFPRRARPPLRYLLTDSLRVDVLGLPAASTPDAALKEERARRERRENYKLNPAPFIVTASLIMWIALIWGAIWLWHHV